MQLDTTLTPINGIEAKKILKSQMNENIDKIPYLREGNAYKQIEVGFELIFSAYPADVPVPIAEWNILIGLRKGENAAFDRDKAKLEVLKDLRAEIAENLDKIDKFLEKHCPTEIFTVVDSDGGTPDELRAKHDLLLPMLKTDSNGRKSEVMVSVEDLANKSSAAKP
jgi:hypothetical protein